MEEMKYVSSVLPRSKKIRRQVTRRSAVTSKACRCSNFLCVTISILLLITTSWKVKARQQEQEQRQEPVITSSSIFKKQELSNTLQPPPIECSNPIDPPYYFRQEDASDDHTTTTQHSLIVDLPQVSPRNLNVNVDYDDDRINLLAWKFNPTPVEPKQPIIDTIGGIEQQKQGQSLPTTPIECIYQEWKVVDPNSDVDIYSLVMGLDQGRLTISITSKAQRVGSSSSLSTTTKTTVENSASEDESEIHEVHHLSTRIEENKQKKGEDLTAFTNELRLKDDTDDKNAGKRLRGNALTELPNLTTNNSTTPFHQSFATSKTTRKAKMSTLRNTMQKSPRTSDFLFFLRSSYSSSSSPSLSPPPVPVNHQQLHKKLYEKFLQISLNGTDEEAYWLRKM